MKERTVTLEHKVPSITCKDCKQEFVLMVVYRSPEYESDHNVMEQVGCFYCPYCGKPQDDDERGKK